MIGVSVRNFVAFPLLVLLAGCGDPFTYPGTWQPGGVNQANLDVEAVNPVDTVVGHQDPGSDAVLDGAAVERLYQDKPRKLPDMDTTGGGP